MLAIGCLVMLVIILVSAYECVAPLLDAFFLPF